MGKIPTTNVLQPPPSSRDAKRSTAIFAAGGNEARQDEWKRRPARCLDAGGDEEDVKR